MKPLTPTEQKIVAAARARVDGAITLLQQSVDVPSRTFNLPGVKKVGALYGDVLKDLGMSVRWIDMPDSVGRAGHLVAENKGRKRGKRVLLIGHLDTVLEGASFRREGNRAYGNGTSDMKSGDVIIIAALQALHDAGALKGANVIVFMTGDEEEAGNPREISRKDLIEAGKRSDYALAFENTVPGTGTVARRGTSSWRLTVTGKQGHSSAIFRPGVGSGAIFEAARILDAWHQQLRGQEFLTFNPGVIVGGTSVTYDDERNEGTASGQTNVIAQRVVVEGDLRFLSMEQRDAARATMQQIAAASHPETSAEIEFHDGYPAMSPKEGNYKVLGVFDGVSQALGYGPIVAFDPGKRGAGDISWVAPYVPACLDGLGGMGGEEHAPGEYVDLESFPMLIERAALLIYRLTR